MHCPEKRNAVQKAEEQRRITQGRQRSADVTDQKNEKNNGVCFMNAPGIGTQEGTYQQHGRSRGADNRSQEGADEQHDGVYGRRAFQCSPDVNASGYSKQCPEQQDKRDVVDEDNMRYFMESRFSEEIDKRQSENDSPKSRHLWKMAVPETG